MHRGYIKLWRKYQDNEFWKERRQYSKAEAWLDILMQVQHSENIQHISLGMSVVECKQGQAIKSLDTWAGRWHWHKSKVRRFLKLLQKRTMIDSEALPQTTRITVLSYDTYSGNGHTDETEVKQKRNTDDTHSTPDKNVKNEKNVKKPLPPVPDWLQETWTDFLSHRKQLRKPMTHEAQRRMLGRVIREGKQRGKKGLDLAMEHGWQAPVWDHREMMGNKLQEAGDRWRSV